MSYKPTLAPKDGYVEVDGEYVKIVPPDGDMEDQLSQGEVDFVKGMYDGARGVTNDE